MTRKIIDDIEIGHYAGYNLFGRTEVNEPLPVDPDFKQSNRLWVFALYSRAGAARGAAVLD